jgi:GNAT superfamily N-acetyltransferase
MTSDSAIVLGAALGGELVGVSTAYEDLESVRFGRRVCVEDLAVHPDHRSLGIGKQLLDEAIPSGPSDPDGAERAYLRPR